MGHSSMLGTDPAAAEPIGREAAALGPGDNSDSGSDVGGLGDAASDDPVERHPARPDASIRDGRDIGVDRVFAPGDRHVGQSAEDGTEDVSDDEDADLAFIDEAQAGDPVEDEDEPVDGAVAEGGLTQEDDNTPGARPPERALPRLATPASGGEQK